MAGYVELYKLTKVYETAHGHVAVVRDFELNMDRSEFVSVIGHSGCGKSTVLTMVAGLNDISSGSVVVAGREIQGAGPDRGVVFQAPCLLPWLTAFENVLLGVDRVYAHVSRAERRDVARYYLSIVGLGDALQRYPKELSEGMQQRVGIARAFALAPKMLLLDEPFGKLDSLTRIELQDVLIELLERDPKATLMVTHDVDEALFLSDRVVMMTQGPEAKVGDTLTVPFERPRNRKAVLEHPRYYELRARILGFLEKNEPHAVEFDVAAMSAPDESPLEVPA
jgi:nitrate/nitrite transport system ATP-binding protein